MKTKILKVNVNFLDEDLIREAAGVLKKGGLVAFPTETVYGIGANYLDKKAIDKLYEIKKRQRSKPFTVQVARFDTLKELGIILSERAKKITRKFWPGPLTVIAQNKKKEKVGIRMPSNKIALALLNEASIPLVVPSANISGEKPPSTGEEVISEMNGKIDMILDGGATEIGIGSTVLDVTKEPFTILREGVLSKKDLLADYHILFVCTGNSCRSVMAKAILEKLLKQSGLFEKVSVDSAGTGAYSEVQAAPNTIEVMKEEGIDVSSHRGKRVTPELLKRTDFIFVMEQRHKDIILNILPEVGLKVRLLNGRDDVPDPMGKPIEEYRHILDIIKHEVENIFLELFKKEMNG